MSADNPVVLNEEIIPKYESYSSQASGQPTDTLDEPVIDTIKRDLMEIYKKIRVTLTGDGDYDQIKKEWDLWGPLVISLVTASLAASGTSGSLEEVFTNVFLGIWLGPLAIALNAKLLGAKVYLMPDTLCLIIYCSTPIMVLAFAIFIFNFILHWFFLNLLLAVLAVGFVLKTNRSLFEEFLPTDRKLLGLYPVLLFYTFMGIFLAMT